MRQWLASIREFRIAAGLAVVVLFLTLGVATLHDYGTIWDSVELFIGDKYFYFYTSGNPAYLDLLKDNIPVYQRADHPYLFRYAGFQQATPHHVWPLGPMSCAATKHLLYTLTHLLDPLDASHVAIVLWAALLIGVLYFWALRHFGLWPALTAGLVLASYPRYWAEVHNNLKDVPSCTLFTLVILLFHDAIENRRPGRLWACGILWGLALAAKANALFLALILGPYFLLVLGQRARRREPLLGGPGMVLPLLCFAPLGLLTMFLLWPYLWLAFPAHVLDWWHFLTARGGGADPHWSLIPAVYALTTMPLPVLGLSVVGLATLAGRAWRARRLDGLTLILLLWLTTPVLRVMVPGSRDFDGIRHWLEFVPAVALLAGVGAGAVLEWLTALVRARRQRPWCGWCLRHESAVAIVVVLLWLSPVVVWNVRHHPFQIVFFNSLIGGLGGAQALALPDATDYWGSSYRQGERWLNAHAPPGSMVVVGVGQTIVHLNARTWLRPDLVILNLLLDPDTAQLQPRVRAAMAAHHGNLYLMYVTRTSFYTPWVRECDATLPPVCQFTVDGGVILKILLVKEATR